MDTLERTHVVTDPAILYFGTPVVLLSTVNPAAIRYPSGSSTGATAT